jgi:hypothetical protein
MADENDDGPQLADPPGGDNSNFGGGKEQQMRRSRAAANYALYRQNSFRAGRSAPLPGDPTPDPSRFSPKDGYYPPDDATDEQ